MMACETPLKNPLAPAPSLDTFRHDRAYLGADHGRNERRTWLVVAICVVTFCAQIGGGLIFHSMALVANGLHLAAHIVVLGAAAGAYGVSRHFANDPRLAFGAGKVGYLVGFTNGVVLAITGGVIGFESLQRVLKPESVSYDGAVALAAFALVVNMVCVWILRPRSVGGHDPDGDLNFAAAHLHLSADAIVSGLALVSLAAARLWRLDWVDPLAALAGAVLVCHFAWRLLQRTGAALLDVTPSTALATEIRRALEIDGTQVTDLHLWRLGPGHHAAIIVLEAGNPQPATAYHRRLNGLSELSHITIEVRTNAES